jgi:hypothetical protein
MTEPDQKPATFLGTYFDRDGVLRLSRWADILAWVVLTLFVSRSWLNSSAVCMRIKEPRS